MAVIVAMPKLSDTMEEGSIAEWFIQEGEQVEEGDTLVAIETDKATMEYASPEEGILLKILVEAGNSANLQQPIAVLGEKGEKVDLAKLTASASQDSGDEKKPEPTPPAPKQVTSTTSVTENQRIRVSPVAKRVAAQKGLDLSSVVGSGPNGRIILNDVEGSPSGTPSIPSASRGSSSVTEKTPHTQMRKTIAKRLLAAKNSAPHFYLTVSADMSEMTRWRSLLNKDYERLGHPKVSMNDLIMLATSRALLQHPMVNSSWDEEAITSYHHVDMAMAVALPTGLITPVIRDAHQLGAREFAAQSKALAQKAKQGKLQPDEYSGGTFTISNLGMTRVESFTAIINPPQAAILAVGSSVKTPVVGADDQIKVVSKMSMTLSCDHRVIDGMVGARFLETLCDFLENPLQMLG